MAIGFTSATADANSVANERVFLDESLEYMNWQQFVSKWKKAKDAYKDNHDSRDAHGNNADEEREVIV